MKRFALVAALCLSGLNVGADEPAEQFVNPPDYAKPWVYWWWLDSNVSKEGITADLEAMKLQGIGGALVFDAGEGHTSPQGPLFMSAEWLELFKHAVFEASRLGMQLSFNICSGWDAGGTWVTPENAIKKISWIHTDVEGGARYSQQLPMPPVVDGYYKDVAVLAYKRLETEPSEPPTLDARTCVTLTDKLDESGMLTWDVPQGWWTVLRFGQTIHGNDYEKKTKSASRGAQGYEIDFYNREALDLHYAETAGKVLSVTGEFAGKTLAYFHDDSWECGEPTWTPKMREEFIARRGYDPMPYLPVLAGWGVDDTDVSARFMRDFRRTAADLMADNHYGHFHELAARSGMGIHPESGGPFYSPMMDPLMNLGRNDIPMGEFWIRRYEPDGEIAFVDQYPKCDSVKQAATAAHIYGKKLCQAEAFTNMGRNWEEAPCMLKDIGDRAFCAGLTRTVLCFYVHQPYLDIKPGYQWPEAGTHFDRNITWWEQMHAYTRYLSRCQLLLQQGLFVADICYFGGDDAGGFVPGKRHMNPELPAGYDCDMINSEVLTTRVSVRDGRVTLPDGMSYRVLVLPPKDAMTPESLGKIAELIEAGATVIGSRPTRSSSLKNYPACDVEVKALAEKIWGPCDGRAVTENAYGKGRVVCGMPIEDVLRGQGVLRDFEFTSTQTGADIDYIHRRDDGADIYFVSNQKDRLESILCTFRVNGQPQLWDAVTGKIYNTEFTSRVDGRTDVALDLAPRGSMFVVFREQKAATDAVYATNRGVRKLMDLTGPWTVRFDTKWGGPESVEFAQLVDWTRRPEEGVKYYSGKATYEKTFVFNAELDETHPPDPSRVETVRPSILLDLGEVRYVAEVRLNGENLGVLWTRPFVVDITDSVKAGENKLEIDVVNLWPNRLIGDSKLPPEKRYTVTNVQKFYAGDKPLLPSGLLGPVEISCR